MPEGDTILRTAVTLDRWLSGRRLTAARSQVAAVDPARLVGRTVLGVEAQAKHVLIRLSRKPEQAREPLLTLRTHQRMNGAWHVYAAGAPWRRPEYQARVVLDAGGRLAVCFNAPVVELFPTRQSAVHPTLRALGPDVLGGPIAAGEIWRRATGLLPADAPLGELLLDQRVVSGIGNIYRSESLFVCGLHPWTAWPDAGPQEIDRLTAAAAELMGANIGVAHDGLRGFGRGPGRTWVYGRQGRPCRRCGSIIGAGRIGRQARTVWWCPSCQPAAQRRSSESADSQDQHRCSSSGPT